MTSSILPGFSAQRSPKVHWVKVRIQGYGIALTNWCPLHKHHLVDKIICYLTTGVIIDQKQILDGFNYSKFILSFLASIQI